MRDLFGRWVDLLVLPVAVGKPFTDPIYGASTLVFSSLDERAEADDRLRRLKDGSQDHYKALRDDYLRNRQAEIDQLHAKKAAARNLATYRTAAAPPRRNKASITWCPRTSLAAVAGNMVAEEEA
ncbi:MAG: VacJ family lipoprotein [Sphingomonadales bacterium]|nr:VacJ family lipoprotein [Sphingomonadales bacterium]